MTNKTNQCDGCQRGLPVDENGNHKGKGYDLIGCTADRYKEMGGNCNCDLFQKPMYHFSNDPHGITNKWGCHIHGNQEKYFLLHTEKKDYCVLCKEIEKKCCELCRPNSLERKHGLDNCRNNVCGCHFISPSTVEPEECSHQIESNMCDPYCRKCGIPLPSATKENWEDEFEKRFYIEGDERYGRVKAYNTIYQQQVDFIRSLLATGSLFTSTDNIEKKYETQT